MTTEPDSQERAQSGDEREVVSLYQRLLDAWNRRDAAGFAELFADGATVVGFDGSVMAGPAEIDRQLARIFAAHVTAAYVGIVRAVRFIEPTIALLTSVSGLVPRGQERINPQTNAVQSLLAQRRGGQWHIVLYQNTPAQFHGRPDLAEQLTEELQQAAARAFGWAGE